MGFQTYTCNEPVSHEHLNIILINQCKHTYRRQYIPNQPKFLFSIEGDLGLQTRSGHLSLFGFTCDRKHKERKVTYCNCQLLC